MIYNYYANLKNSEDFKNQKELIIQINLVYIISKWCDRVEDYMQKISIKSLKINKDLFADYQEFTKNEAALGAFFALFKVKSYKAFNLIKIFFNFK